MPPTLFTRSDLTVLLRVADLPLPPERHAMLTEQFASLLAGALALNSKLRQVRDIPPITQFGHIVPDREDQP